jgi:hypothetical protein
VRRTKATRGPETGAATTETRCGRSDLCREAVLAFMRPRGGASWPVAIHERRRHKACKEKASRAFCLSVSGVGSGVTARPSSRPVRLQSVAPLTSRLAVTMTGRLSAAGYWPQDLRPYDQDTGVLCCSWTRPGADHEGERPRAVRSSPAASTSGVAAQLPGRSASTRGSGQAAHTERVGGCRSLPDEGLEIGE